MQAEISAEPTARPVRILGVNAAGEEAGNSIICQGRRLPWLQDTAADGAWAAWRVTYRDVVVLDARNEVVAVYNLTLHDLAVAANRDELKALLRTAAAR